MLNRVSLNTALQLFARVLELISGVLVNAWLARRWGSQVFGQIGFVSSLAGVCAFMFDLGLSQLLFRRIAQDREKAWHLLAHATLAMLPCSALACAALVGLGVAGHSTAFLTVLMLSGLHMFLTAWSQLLRATFYAHERMEFESLSVLAERACWIACGLYLATQPASLPAMFAALAACKAVNLLVGGALFAWAIRPRVAVAAREPGLARDLLRQAFPFGLNGAFSTIYLSVDVLLLAVWAGDQQTGFYRAACMLILPLAMLPIALNNALFPRMAAAGDPAAIRRYADASARLVMIAAVPIALFVALFAKALIAMLFGPEYAPAAMLLQTLALVIPLRFLNNTLATSLTAAGLQRQRTGCAGAAAAFNVVANALVLGQLQALGACLTTLATDLLMIVLLQRCLAQALGGAAFGATTALRSLALAGAILAPLVWLGAPIWAAGVVLALAYPLLLGLFRVLSPFEVALLLRRSEA